MNHFLKNARAKRFLSIDKASAKVGVEPRTFKRWEHDDYNPQLYFLKKLCEAFDATPEELGYSISAEGKVSRIAPIHLRAQAYSDGILAPAEQIGYPLLSMEADELGLQAERDWTTWFGIKQAQIMTMIGLWRGKALCCCDEIPVIIDQEIKTIDDELHLHQMGEQQAISRRQALITIVALPTTLAWEAGLVTDTALEEFLPRCAASVTVCWHLMRGKGLAAIREILPKYVSLLATVALRPSKYQQVAARLATQTSIIQAILAMHWLNFTVREAHCHDAVRYARISQDNKLQAASLMYLAYTYSHCYYPHQPQKAVPIFHQALHALADEESLLRSDILMGLSEAYAQCKEEQEALHYMDQAQKHFPAYPEHDPSFIYADCGLNTLYQWQGKMYLQLVEYFPDADYQQKAASSLLQSISVDSISERSASETMIYQADAARISGELKIYAETLRQAAQKAREIGSRRRYHDALLVYQRTPEKWVNEQPIQALAKDFFKRPPHRKGVNG